MVKGSQSEHPAEAKVNLTTGEVEVFALADELRRRLHLGSRKRRGGKPSASRQVGGTRIGMIEKKVWKEPEKSRWTWRHLETGRKAMEIWERTGMGLTEEEIADYRESWLYLSSGPVPAWMEPGAAEAAKAEFGELPPEIEAHINSFRLQKAESHLRLILKKKEWMMETLNDPNLTPKRREWLVRVREKQDAKIREWNQKIEALRILPLPEMWKPHP